MRLRALLGIGLLAMGAAASAQDHPVNSPAYHAVHNPQSPYYTGPRQQPVEQQPPRPTGYWEKTWGAIATSETGGALGTAVGVSDESQAEQVALRDCKAKGGGGCEIGLTYHNQCAAMIVGDKTYNLAHAASIDEATEIGMNLCKEKNGSCSVYYTACTEPIFHKY